MFQELINSEPLYLDGGKIEKTGFKYEYPEPTQALLQEVGDCNFIHCQVFNFFQKLFIVISQVHI